MCIRSICLAHGGEDNIQHLEQDSSAAATAAAAAAGPCHDSTAAENIVKGLMIGNAEMVCMFIIHYIVQLTFFHCCLVNSEGVKGAV